MPRGVHTVEKSPNMHSVYTHLQSQTSMLFGSKQTVHVGRLFGHLDRLDSNLQQPSPGRTGRPSLPPEGETASALPTEWGLRQSNISCGTAAYMETPQDQALN